MTKKLAVLQVSCHIWQHKRKQMASKPKYRLSELVNGLPRSVNPTKDLEGKGIPERTFYRDKAIAHGSTQTISGDRLQIYAQYFNVTMEQLFTTALKVKTRAKSKVKSGLR